MLLTIALSGLAVMAFEQLGYIITMVLYVSSLLIFVARKNIVFSILGTLVAAVATAYLFEEVGVALPGPYFDLPHWIPLS